MIPSAEVGVRVHSEEMIPSAEVGVRVHPGNEQVFGTEDNLVCTNVVGIDDAIQIHTRISDSLFREEKIVFKIQTMTKIGEQVKIEEGIVQTYQDYFKNIRSHFYTPLLHIADLTIRLAYIYSCLNIRYGEERRAVFRVLYRYLNTDEWGTWFTVYPYSEKIKN
jgi:hypothetical protein